MWVVRLNDCEAQEHARFDPCQRDKPVHTGGTYISYTCCSIFLRPVGPRLGGAYPRDSRLNKSWATHTSGTLKKCHPLLLQYGLLIVLMQHLYCSRVCGISTVCAWVWADKWVGLGWKKKTHLRCVSKSSALCLRRHSRRKMLCIAGGVSKRS